jgi:phytoene dehydrogenase-like protein
MTRSTVVIVGAGMGGLSASLRLAQRGFRVQVIEARPGPGGLASAIEIEGFKFDAGPYILLDRNGLEWAFRSLGLELADLVSLRRIEDIYQVSSRKGTTVSFFSDLERTAAGFEQSWPGSAKRYTEFVASSKKKYDRLQRLLYNSRPRPLDLARDKAWTCLPFLLSSLGSVLARARLPEAVIDAIGVWTHVAGQQLEGAPSIMAFVPALFHGVGAYYPAEGIGRIPQALASAAQAAGVEFRYDTKIARIRCDDSRVRGVETEAGEFIAADAIVSNCNGVGTYLKMLDPAPRNAGEAFSRLPLQSPGVIAYMAVKGVSEPPYLRFNLPGGGEFCRVLVTPSVMARELERNGWWPVRLIAPMSHKIAESSGPAGQRDYLDRILGEGWWREWIRDYRILAVRTPSEWGAEFNLYRDSMNPVMTARFMRAGRLAHRSPYVRGLYLAGSATHPGQWVSFCAISGILAADRVFEDLK